MASLGNVAGLVIVLDGPVMPALARLAVRQGWPVLEMASARQAIPRILRREADLYIVQVSVGMDEAAELIRLLRAAPRRVPILAVAVVHNAWVERAAREAGATCYLPGCDVPEVLEQEAAHMLSGGQGRPFCGRPRRGTAPWRTVRGFRLPGQERQI